jgi:hypothetical protein
MLKCLIAIVLVSVAVSVPASSAAADRLPACARGLATLEFDPSALLPLTTPNPIAPAIRAAMRYERPLNRPLVTSAILATADPERGLQAKTACGARVWRRTVVVYVTDRAMLPSQSLSQRVFFVGRVRSGYRVWQIVH